LKGRHDGRLDVVYCDYFLLDVLPPDVKPKNAFIMTADKLFTDLGISGSKWTDDCPVKVVGIVPQVKERAALLKMVYNLFERVSVNKFGRMDLFLFMSESEYLCMVTKPGDMIQYRTFSAFCQMAWDIELLHMEPYESFETTKRSLTLLSRKSKYPNKHLCLVHLRPKADLFNRLTNVNTLLVMVQQCLVKRRARLIDKLNQWSPDSGSKLLKELDMHQDILTGHVYPDEYRRLFELIEKSPEFKHSWLYEEIHENKDKGGPSWL